MGTVIRKDAAAGDIGKDVRTSLTRAQAQGGVAKDRAEETLAPVCTLMDGIETQLNAAEKAAAPLVAAVAAANGEADDLLGEVADILYNAVGRPAPGTDPALAVLLPGGIAYYAEGDTEGQPDRMDVLAQLLTAGIHPKLSAGKAADCAAKVTASAEALRTQVELARKPAATLGVLRRMQTSVARVGQMQLANLKRVLKAAGFTEAQVHAIIPDRPASPGKKAPGGGDGGGGAPGGAPV